MLDFTSDKVGLRDLSKELRSCCVVPSEDFDLLGKFGTRGRGIAELPSLENREDGESERFNCGSFDVKSRDVLINVLELS